MTKNNFKIVFVAVLAVGLLGSSVVFSQDAIGATDNQTKGKNTINDSLPIFDDPKIEQATKIMEKLNKEGISETEKAKLIEKLQAIKAESNQAILSTKTLQAPQSKIDLITKSLIERTLSSPLTSSNTQATIIGYYADDVTGDIVIHVDAMEFSNAKAKQTLKDVRDLVGEKVNVIVEPMGKIIPQACSQTGNCEPAQGGVKISLTEGPCSVGFKASYSGKTGFITAGHCTDGNTGSGVGQPDYFWWDHIGTAHTNSLTGSTTTYDGLFVDADETISDKVYLNHDISYAGNAGYLDGVIMEGHVSKGVSGVVLVSSYSGYINGVLVTDMALTNYVGQNGDSGGTVYGIVPSDHLLGTHSGKLTGQNLSVFSKQQNALVEFPGLAWQFN